MRRFFPERIEDGIAYFSAEESRHMAKVLRMQPQDKIIVPEGRGEWVCELAKVSVDGCTAKTLTYGGCNAEPKKKLTLYMAYTKSDKMELCVQKAVELGVSSFVPFISSRCVKIPDDAGAKKANARFKRIAFEAVKQCGRANEAEILLPISFEELLKSVSEHELTLFAYEASEGSLKDCFNSKADDYALVIGPEGGFTPYEAEQITKAGAKNVSLGTRILRAETAAIALAAITAYESGC